MLWLNQKTWPSDGLGIVLEHDHVVAVSGEQHRGR